MALRLPAALLTVSSPELDLISTTSEETSSQVLDCWNQQGSLHSPCPQLLRFIWETEAHRKAAMHTPASTGGCRWDSSF